MKTSNELVQYFLKEAPILSNSALEQFGDISEAELNWKPHEESWSIGECITHLVITHQLYDLKLSGIILKKSKISGGGSSPFHHTFGGKMILQYVDPVTIKKSKTFKIFKPGNKLVAIQTLELFREEVQKMISFVRDLDDIDLTKLKISSPVNRFIRINVGDAFLINLYHDKRHLNQAERILNQIEIPR